MCAPQPYSQGMMIYTKYSDPLICTGCWLQDPPTQIAKFKNAQVLYIILCSMHIVLDTLHQLYNTPHTDYSVNAMQTVITLCCLVNNDKTRKSIRAQCSFVLLL
jgi:hypothetical protein